MIKVNCEVKVLELDDKDTTANPPVIQVSSHWNDDKLVILKIDGTTYAVQCRDLKAAIDNVVHTARW